MVHCDQLLYKIAALSAYLQRLINDKLSLGASKMAQIHFLHLLAGLAWHKGLFGTSFLQGMINKIIEILLLARCSLPSNGGMVPCCSKWGTVIGVNSCKYNINDCNIVLYIVVMSLRHSRVTIGQLRNMGTCRR